MHTNSLIKPFIGRTLFLIFRSQDFDFKPLPDLLLQHETICEKFNGYFSGDPNKIL